MIGILLARLEAEASPPPRPPSDGGEGIGALWRRALDRLAARRRRRAPRDGA